jgi:hypothetical protein
VRIEVRADEAELSTCVLQFPDPFHAFVRIEPGHAVEAIRMLLDRLGDERVGQVIARGMTEPPGARRDQESALDSRRVHATQRLVQADSVGGLLRDFHLALVERVALRPQRIRLRASTG